MSLSAASTKSTKSTNSIKLQPPPSKFKECLSDVVPKAMLEGISVVKVNANGKTKSSYLTLSTDKFTIYVTNKFKAGKASFSEIRKPPLFWRIKATGIMIRRFLCPSPSFLKTIIECDRKIKNKKFKKCFSCLTPTYQLSPPNTT